MDGEWTSWNEVGPCPVVCGWGKQERNRSCANPAPQFDGSDCVGNATDTQDCVTDECQGEFASKSDVKFKKKFIVLVSMEAPQIHECYLKNFTTLFKHKMYFQYYLVTFQSWLSMGARVVMVMWCLVWKLSASMNQLHLARQWQIFHTLQLESEGHLLTVDLCCVVVSLEGMFSKWLWALTWVIISFLLNTIGLHDYISFWRPERRYFWFNP